MLEPKQRAFVREYCVDYNATQAAIRAGYSEKTAGSIGGENLQKPEINEAIQERMAELAAAAELTPQWILKRWMELATADPGDLARVKRVNCRHCNGFDFNYQWTAREYRKALDKAIKEGQGAPEFEGGLDYKPNGEINPECPECGGEGVAYTLVEDTRKVVGHGRKLFAGVKQTKDGIEIKMRDQDGALANLAKYLGMSLERKEVSGPGGGPIAIGNLTAGDFTDDQLAALIAGESQPKEEENNANG